MTSASSVTPIQPSQRMRQKAVLGVNVSATDYGQVLRLCRVWIEQRRAWRAAGANPDCAPSSHSINLLNVHSVMTAVMEPDLRAVLNQADISVPDGMPLAWALRSFGINGQKRVYGPDLTLALCGQAARLGHGVFLYGGREQTLPVLCARLQTLFPSLQIAGFYSPPFRPLTREEDAACIETIRNSGADLLFVGIGAPKQERWMAAHREHFSGIVMLGVGAAFDFHAGRVKQAPRWIQNAGLEWLFRLLMEPARLWRRYMLLNPAFLVMWGLQRAGILRYPEMASGPAEQATEGAHNAGPV